MSRIVEGGPAERDGKLKIGDRVISVSIIPSSIFLAFLTWKSTRHSY